MLRILLIVLVFAMVIAFFSRKRSVAKTKYNENSTLSVTKIVKCALCDLHVAQEDAVEDKGQFFCCVEHRQNLEKGSQ